MAGLPSGITYEIGMLSKSVVAQSGAETVVLSHVLEHMPDLRQAAESLAASSHARLRVVVAWPVLEQWVAARLAGAVNFEHGIYVKEHQLTALFRDCGLALIERVFFGPMRTAMLAFGRVQTGGSAGDEALSMVTRSNLLADVRAYFAAFEMLARTLQDKVSAHDGDIFLSPASVYAQFLLASGLRESSIRALLDNAPVKQGKRLFGTSLSVAAPEAVLLTSRSPLVIVTGGAHSSSLAAQFRALREDAAITIAS
jgi:hypothetical protein